MLFSGIKAEVSVKVPNTLGQLTPLLGRLAVQLTGRSLHKPYVGGKTVPRVAPVLTYDGLGRLTR